ncbi:hypothetical protein K438DRAFT_1589556, partial [Mycena galopus ATCC 62051]
QDTRTAFWNSYMKLADEYDTELQQKYGTDLNAGLIFAGLFSAVSSGFIIQIQPELQPPNLPGTKIIVAQSLLYISLFATLLASLSGSWHAVAHVLPSRRKQRYRGRPWSRTAAQARRPTKVEIGHGSADILFPFAACTASVRDRPFSLFVDGPCVYCDHRIGPHCSWIWFIHVPAGFCHYIFRFPLSNTTCTLPR